MATATQSKPKTTAKPKADQDTADRVLEQVQTGGQSAIEAVRRFIDSADESLRGGKTDPTFVHDLVDSALEMSDRMVASGGDALRGVVRNISVR
jgi:hypothetical protein